MSKNYEVVNLGAQAGIEPMGINFFNCVGIEVICPNVCPEINNRCGGDPPVPPPPHDWFCPLPNHTCYGNNPHCPTSIGSGSR